MSRREAIAVGAATAAALTTPARGVQAVPGTPREELLLDDGWRFHLGHAADATLDFGFGADQRTFAKAGLTSPATLAGFNDAGWETIKIPHDWATELPFAVPSAPAPSDHADAVAAHGFKALGRAFPQNSIGWYRRTLPLSAADAGRRIFLEFDGVFRDSIVFIDGYAVAREESGYAPFVVDITDFLDLRAPTQLAVRVDASLGEGWFYEGAGIYRHVRLIKTGAVHVPRWGTFVRSDIDGGGASIAIETDIRVEHDGPVDVIARHSIVSPSGTTVARMDAQVLSVAGHSTATSRAGTHLSAPELWSLGSPRLYRCVTELVIAGAVVDRTETRFGIRAIRFDAERGFFLNGEPIKLLGTCNHQDHAGVGTAIPDRLHAWRVEQLQSMGCNALRSAHNPPAAALLDICDEKGVLVLDEARLNSTSVEAIDQLTRMVRRDRNHPCVILWSVGNEEPQQGTPRGALISAEMRRQIRVLDPTRPITQAFDQAFGEGATQVVDVIGFNYRTDQIPAYHARFPNQPIIATEAASTVATRGVYANDPAAHLLRAYDTEHPWWATTAAEWWKIVDAHPYIGGGFIWTGFDYRGEPTPYPQWPSTSSQFGVLDLCGFPKDNYWYYRACWRKQPLVHLLPHWTWPGREGQPIEVWAYANCDEVELLANGRSLGRKPMERDGHLAWSAPYAPGRIEAIGYIGGKVVARDRRDTAGPAAAVCIAADRMRIAADGRDLAVLTMSIVDRRGRIVPDAADPISIQPARGLRLLGTGNGDPNSTLPDHVATRPAFHGLAQAIVQSDGSAGPLRIGASAPGLVKDEIVLLAFGGKREDS